MAYKSVLLKLSGEAFGGGQLGVDPDVVGSIAAQIAEVAHSGVQVAIVVGGGNIFGAGSGMPFFSTDTVAAQRALEVGCEIILLAKQGVDGVYDDDPRKNPNAKRYTDLTYDEYLAKDLKVADATAMSLARDNHLSMLVFNLDEPGNIARAVAGEPIGTFVPVSYTHLRAHETVLDLVCRL